VGRSSWTPTTRSLKLWRTRTRPEYDDPWGADAFLEDIDGSAYGTTPETLREGLDVLATEETVWISPGTPFLVPVFAGLVIALVYGDLLLGTLFDHPGARTFCIRSYRQNSR